MHITQESFIVKLAELNRLYTEYRNKALKTKDRTVSHKLRDAKHKILYKIESLLIEYLADHPRDTDMWLQLLMVEFTPPLDDWPRIEEYAANIFAYDPYNIDAALVLAYSQYALGPGRVHPTLFAKLCQLNTTDPEKLSMIELAKARYYQYVDLVQYEHCLLSSIQHCQKHVNNYVQLGRLYMEQEKFGGAQEALQTAINNIKYIYRFDGTQEYTENVTDLNKFFNEFYKGTHKTYLDAEDFEKFIKICNEKLSHFNT